MGKLLHKCDPKASLTCTRGNGVSALVHDVLREVFEEQEVLFMLLP